MARVKNQSGVVIEMKSSYRSWPSTELSTMTTKQVLLLMLIVTLAGCSPYVLAARETYEVATDPRSLVTQATDTEVDLR
jgi:hypothetical protein